MSNFNSIHETVIRDVLDVLGDAISMTKDAANKASSTINNLDSSKSGGQTDIKKISSLNAAAQGLTLTFPVMSTTAVTGQTASMIAKALERKDVSLLQILFTAYNVSADNAQEFIRAFHTNLNASKMNLDDIIQALDSIVESTRVPMIPQSAIAAVYEDCRNNTSFVLPDNINESSLNDFKVLNRYGTGSVIKEAVSHNDYANANNDKNANDKKINPYFVKKHPKDYIDIPVRDDDGPLSVSEFIQYQYPDGAIPSHEKIKSDYADYLDEYKKTKNNNERHALEVENIQKQLQTKDFEIALQKAELNMSVIKNQLIPTDVKKANELVPSLMLINYCTPSDKGRASVGKQAVIGVKSKLYAVNSQDIIDKLVQKNIDSNFLLKLVKVTTREISFVKDFLLAIDNAKVNALAKSKKGSASKLFKILERRSISGKVRKMVGANINVKPITSLVISIDEVNHMRKFNNLDLMNPNIARKLMEQLNLMFLVIADESNEVAHFLADTGDDLYESITFDHLEKESNDSGYKKMINLMTKTNR